jgi:hypothetical protein
MDVIEVFKMDSIDLLEDNSYVWLYEKYSLDYLKDLYIEKQNIDGEFDIVQISVEDKVKGVFALIIDGNIVEENVTFYISNRKFYFSYEDYSNLYGF